MYHLQLRSDRVTPTVLAYWLLSGIGRYQIEVDARGSSQSMVKVSDRETASIDALVAKVHAAIDRFKELRTALISAAVTGEIDVREEVA